MVSVVIHSNPHLANQIESSGWLQSGFKAHGINAEITADKNKAADIHVIQGNWYAYNEFIGKPNVLFLNRCFYGDARFDVSLGWLRPDGSRDFMNHGMVRAKGSCPNVRPRKDRKRRCAVVFADYGIDPQAMILDARMRYDSVFFRPHPAQDRATPVMTLKGSLDAVWEIADVAISGSSTVLVDALIQGLHVESTDPLHVVQSCGEDRQAWLNDLSWAQWHGPTELMNGDFWEHLCVRAD